MVQFSAHLEKLRQAAARLAGETITVFEAAGNGANSQIYRVSTPSRTLALKCYPQRPGDVRDRLKVEWSALNFLRARGLDSVPAPIAHDESNRLILMEWLEGEPVSVHTTSDLDSSIDFMTRILASSSAPGADEFPPASEACLSAKEIVRQIDARLDTFVSHPVLDEFLNGAFRPVYKSICAGLKTKIEREQPLPRTLQRLIPADFGFHNALRTAHGRLRFFDFDYFGWDDPVKLAADFVLHPAMSLSQYEQQLLVDRMAAALPEDKHFSVRLKRYKPLYALRWALILLNRFRSDRIEIHQHGNDALEDLLDIQITKAKRFCVAEDA